MKRRAFITLLSGAAFAAPLAGHAQQPTLPVVGFIQGGPAAVSPRFAAAFRKGLNETGFEDQNVTVEYYWESEPERLTARVANLVSRHVAVIAAPGSTPAALAAKAATATIPIVFSVADDPIALGLVASLARPGGNATGVNFLVQEQVNKRLGLLHELVPKAIRFAVLVNPTNAPNTETTLREAKEAAPAMGLQISILNASTSTDIDAAFATFARERPEALFIAADAFFVTHRVQLANLASRERIPAIYSNRDYVTAGGLMSYGTDVVDTYRQAGVYTGKILKGAKPADLAVMQSTKFELVINRQTARALNIEVPPGLLGLADEVIE
jgi:putative ABC transport system substrate-binding protein